MAQPRPWEISVGIGLETAFGTAVAPSIWIPGTSSLKKTPGRAVLERPVGEWEESRTTQRPTKVEGGLELEVAPGRNLVIRQMLIRKGLRNLNSVTVVDTLGDQAGFQNAGITAKSAEFKCASGEDLIASFDCVGRTRERITPVAPVFNSAPAPYTFEEGVFSLAGANEEHLAEVGLKYDFKAMDDKFRSGGGGLLKEVPTDGQEAIFSVEHDFDETALWDAVMEGAQIAVVLTFTRGANILTCTAPRCEYFEGDVESNTQTPQLRALKGLDGTAAVTWAEA
jgi:hypothetical protein